MVELSAALTALVIGSALLMLSAFWTPALATWQDAFARHKGLTNSTGTGGWSMQGGIEALASLGTVVRIVLWLFIAGCVFTILLQLLAIFASEMIFSNPEVFGIGTVAAGGILLLAFLASIVVIALWLHRAHGNLHEAGPWRAQLLGQLGDRFVLHSVRQSLRAFRLHPRTVEPQPRRKRLARGGQCRGGDQLGGV